jgi:hypothetical protein
MPAFLIKYTISGSSVLADAVIRAPSLRQAGLYLAPEYVAELVELKDEVATAMGVPPEEGRHVGALLQWLLGPVSAYGERLRMPN